ncbi:MAG: hypothetical protein KU38_04140 [Sulfurovum sp. FS08-3]|jgi:hypothetical protein|nr:MAG: hypothetical protein KU28_03265 [Sulfurovum sp. PC08-66]KIM12105.1 MAG: hypothetical protein KU38_04140 [Sulfurovum sp. FS08-3]
MLYIPKAYFSLFGIMASTVGATLSAFAYAIKMLNLQRIQTLKIRLIALQLNANIQSKTK